MKSGKSGIQYRISEATGLGYSRDVKEISKWRQVKRSTVESSAAARQLHTRKIMQSPLLKSKDRIQTHLVYLFFVLYDKQSIVSGTPAFKAERTTTLHTTQAVGTRNQSLDT